MNEVNKVFIFPTYKLVDNLEKPSFQGYYT